MPGSLAGGGQLLGDRPQDGQIRRVVAGPGLPRVAQVGPGRGQVAGLELGQGGGQGQPGIGRGGLGTHAGERAAQLARGRR